MGRKYTAVDLLRFRKFAQERAGVKPVDLIEEYNQLYPELTREQQWENVKKALGKKNADAIERALAEPSHENSGLHKHDVTNRNLSYKVMLRSCGAINNANGTYTIQEDELKAWFKNGDHLKQYTDYDLW